MLKDQRILALDIGASTVKMAEFVPLKSGGIELVKFGVGTLALDPQSEDERLQQITATIRELQTERGFKLGDALIAVSGQSVFSRFVKLPPVDKQKVYQIILYEAQQNVPFPIDEVVWDYQLIGRGEGELDVMLAAIKADIIVGLTGAVEEAGLQTDLVDVAPMAIYNAVRYNYSDLTGCTLVIDIGARSTDLIFMEEGRVFSRSVPVAGNAITQQIMREFELSFDDAEDMKRAHAYVAFGGAYEGPQSEVADKVSKIVRGVMTRMHAEIDRSIKFYRSQQNGQQPSLILLTGGCSIIPYSDVFLKDKLKVDVDYLNPFTNVPVSPEIDAEEIGRHAHQLAGVVGVALRRALSCPIEINLLPPNVMADKAFRKKQPLLVAAAMGLVLILALFCGFFLKSTSLAREKLKRVEARVRELEAIERPLRQSEEQMAAVDGRLQTIEQILQQRTEWLEILATLQRSLPADLWISSIRPVRQKPTTPGLEAPMDEEGGAAQVGAVERIELTGRGYLDKITSPQPIREFRDRLRATPLFDAQTDISWLPTPGPGEYVRDFKMIIVLKKPIRV